MNEQPSQIRKPEASITQVRIKKWLITKLVSSKGGKDAKVTFGSGNFSFLVFYPWLTLTEC